NKWVIEYDLASQLALFKQVGGAFETGGSAVKGAALAVKDAALHHGPIAALVAAPIALALVLRRRRRRDGFTPSLRPRPRTRSSIAQIYDDVARALARAGVPRDAAGTPRELAQPLAHRVNGVAVQVGELNDLHDAA